MGKSEKTLNFSVIKQAEEFGGGSYGRIDLPVVKGAQTTIKEVVRLKKMQVDEDQLYLQTRQAVLGALELVQEDGIPRTICDLIVIKPILKGRFTHKNDRFDAARHYVKLGCMLKDDMRVNLDGFSFHNNNDGPTLRVSGVVTVGEVESGKVTRGRQLLIGGENLKLIDGDTVAYSCAVDETTTLTGLVAVSSSSDLGIVGEWPEALDEATVGRTVTFTVQGRCGDAEAGPQTGTATAVILAGGAAADTTPAAPTPTEPQADGGADGEDETPTTAGQPSVTSIGEGNSFEVGPLTVHGANMAFADNAPWTHITVSNAAGETLAVTFTAGDTTPTREAFTVVMAQTDAFTPGSTYTFTFDMVDGAGAARTATVEAVYVGA